MTQTKAKPHTISPYLVLAIAILAGSLAPTLVKLAQTGGIASPAIAMGRLAVATLILSPMVLLRYQDEIRQASWQTLLFAAVAGFWLVTHFFLFMFALEITSILVTTVILNTSPIWVAMLETAFLKTRLNRVIWAGLLIAISGGLLIAANSAGSDVVAGDANPLTGNLLALGGAFSAAIYLTIGRHTRKSMSIIPYIWLVFGTGALLALPVIFMLGIPLTGYAGSGYLWIILLGIFPQLIAHGGFNYVVGFLPATLVSVTAQIVTVIASVIGFFIFAEVPGVMDMVGSSVIIGGVILTIYGGQRIK